MAIALVQQTWVGRSGEVDDRAGRRYEAQYVVVMTSHQENAAAVLFASGVPRRGYLFAGDAAAVCVDVRAVQRPEAPLYWDVTAQFSTVDYDPSRDPDDPTSWQPEHWVTFEEYQRLQLVDEDVKPLLNSAGDFFEPETLQIEDERIVLHVRKREKFLAQLVARGATYRRAINSDGFLGQPPFAWKMRPLVTGPPQRTHGGEWYWETEYQLVLRPETWRIPLLDQGYSERVEVQPGIFRLKRILDVDGTPLKRPSNLDGDGKPLPENTAAVFVGAGNGRGAPSPPTTPYKRYKELPFGPLNLLGGGAGGGPIGP